MYWAQVTSALPLGTGKAGPKVGYSPQVVSTDGEQAVARRTGRKVPEQDSVWANGQGKVGKGNPRTQ